MVVHGWSCCGLGRNSELLHLGHGCSCDTEHPDHHWRLHSHWFCSRIAHARRNNYVVRLAGHIFFGQWHLALVIDPGKNSSTTKTERSMWSYCCFWKRNSGNHPPSANLHTEIEGTTCHIDSSVQPCVDKEHGIIAVPETTICITRQDQRLVVQHSAADGRDPSATTAIIHQPHPA